MKYEPKRQKRNTNIALLIGAATIILFFIISTLTKSEEIIYPQLLCELDNNQAIEILNELPENEYAITDFYFYGETLNLSTNEIDNQTTDPLVTKSVSLYNLCTGQESMFILEQSRDRQIPLDALQPGVYAIYINDNLSKRRITTHESLSSTLSTITRSGVTNKVTVFSDVSLFQHPEVKNQQQLFIKVETATTTQYDIVIDPLLYNLDFTYTPNKGELTNGKYTYEYNFEYALALKKELESYGVKVLLTKNEAEEIINSYGEEGRIANAYNSGAKYYIAIHFQELPYNYIQGVDIEYSINTSMRFANSIIYDLKRELNLQPATYYSPTGVHSSTLVEGSDGKRIYGNNLYLREVGGVALNAGAYSENTVTGTGSFAYGNKYGMQGLQISLGYLSNSEDVYRIENQKDEMIRVLAKSIVDYLQVEG